MLLYSEDVHVTGGVHMSRDKRALGKTNLEGIPLCTQPCLHTISSRLPQDLSLICERETEPLLREPGIELGK